MIIICNLKAKASLIPHTSNTTPKTSINQSIKMYIYTVPLKSSQRHLLWVGTLKKPWLKARFKTLSTNVAVLQFRRKVNFHTDGADGRKLKRTVHEHGMTTSPWSADRSRARAPTVWTGARTSSLFYRPRVSDYETSKAHCRNVHGMNCRAKVSKIQTVTYRYKGSRHHKQMWNVMWSKQWFWETTEIFVKIFCQHCHTGKLPYQFWAYHSILDTSELLSNLCDNDSMIV